MEAPTELPVTVALAQSDVCFQTHSLHILQRFRTFRQNLKLTNVPNYVWCALYTAIGGFLFGFDTGSIGPVTVMPQFETKFGTNGSISATIQGLIVSSILLTASVTSLFSGPLSDRFSRTRTISLGGIVFAAGSVITCSATTLSQVFVGRCIAGIGEGLFLSCVTVYAIEIAPASSRGQLVSIIQLWNTFGITSGYFVCYGTVHIPSSLSWRFPFGMQTIIAALFAVGAPLLPHSPRWLRHVGRIADADAAWAKLGVGTVDAEENSQRGDAQKMDWWKEVQQLWKKGIRMRTALGVFLMAMQQASGIDGVLYYAPVLFSQAGLPATTASFVASGVSGIIMFVCTFVVQFFADKWGRRASMIRGGTVISGSMLLIGTLYASHASNTSAGRWTIIVLIYVFIVGFVTSWAIVTRTICSEIQPMRTRAAATSLGQCANWVYMLLYSFLFMTNVRRRTHADRL
ncbi:hypothetical protein AcW2_001162 [Taiwanofungus camphoratus]|nr:hypothetical protein AcW2_001162 [Antrodia cinnamomea]